MGKLYQSNISDSDISKEMGSLERSSGAEILKGILSKYWNSPIFSTITISHPERMGFMKIASIFSTPIRVLDYSITLNILIAPDIFKHKVKGLHHWHEGSAGGHKWRASIQQTKGAFSAQIFYANDKIGPLLTPKKIPRILDKLTEDFLKLRESQLPDLATPTVNEPTIQYENKQFEIGFQPLLKGMLIPKFTNKEKAVLDWTQRANDGVNSARDNPIISGGLKNTKVNVFYAGEKVTTPIGEKIEYPQTPDDLQRFLMVAFGDKAYALLMGLSYFQYKTKRDSFEVKVQDLCKMLFGANYNSKMRRELINTIDALQYLSVKLTQPRNGEEIEYSYTPVLVSQSHRRKKGKLPYKLRLMLWPQDEAKTFSTMAIPEEIFALRQNEFPIACYILLAQGQSNGYHTFKIETDEAMKISGQWNTYKTSNSRLARKRMRDKIKRLAAAGICGAFVKEESGYFVIETLPRYIQRGRAIGGRKSTKGKKLIDSSKKE